MTFGGGDFTPVPRERRAQTVRRIAAFFRPYRWQVLLVMTSIVIAGLLGIINPYLLKLLIDVAIPEQDFFLLNVFVIAMIFIPVISGLIGVGQTYVNNQVGQNVMQDLRNALYAHLQRMPLRFFTETRTGEIQSRLANDVGGVQSVVTDTASSVFSNLIIVVTTLAAMVLLDWRLTAISLTALPFFMYLTYRVGKVRRRASDETQKSLADVSAITEETLSVSGILLAKTFGQQDKSVKRFRVANARLARLQLRQSLVGRWFFMLVGTIFSIMPAFVYWVAGVLVIQGDPTAPTIGDIVAFTTLQSRLFFPLGQLLNVQVEVQGALALFDRIFEYLDMKPEIADAPHAHRAAARRRSRVACASATSRSPTRRACPGHWRWARPSWPPMPRVTAMARAPGGERDARRPGNLARGPRQPMPWVRPARSRMASPSRWRTSTSRSSQGSWSHWWGHPDLGKTTSTYLVPRLYDVDAGAIEIDGRDVRDISLASLGRIIGFVTQEAYLFHASVRENLVYARPDATDRELRAAARLAAIHDRIGELPDGYETVVGERGYKLSGGEKQRIALARVLLKDPRILILDEATSALDTVSERLIQRAIERTMQGRTTLAIAHRLSTILRADLILVYERGRIVERGSHAGLLAQGGAYARLYHEQFEASGPRSPERTGRGRTPPPIPQRGGTGAQLMLARGVYPFGRLASL